MSEMNRAELNREMARLDALEGQPVGDMALWMRQIEERLARLEHKTKNPPEARGGFFESVVCLGGGEGII